MYSRFLIQNDVHDKLLQHEELIGPPDKWLAREILGVVSDINEDDDEQYAPIQPDGELKAVLIAQCQALVTRGDKDEMLAYLCDRLQYDLLARLDYDIAEAKRCTDGEPQCVIRNL